MTPLSGRRIKILRQSFLPTLILSSFLFIVTTFFTLRFESAFDGLDEIGFPFRFYEYYVGVELTSEGKMGKNEVAVRSFHTLYLIADFVSILLLSCFIVYNFRFKKRMISRKL